MSTGFTPVNQVRLTNVAYVKLNRGGKRFELACYRNKVLNWRSKVETDISEVLQIDNIFVNVSKGLLASTKDLKAAFGTTSQTAICKEILDKGELQVSELERQAQYDSLFRDIAAIVTEKTINPNNGRPYTISMIQQAMKEDIHFAGTVTKSAKQQALEVIRKLKAVMPIARINMLLKIICDTAANDQVRQFIDEDDKMTLLSETVEGTMQAFDIRVGPESFRAVELKVTELTGGRGRVEVVQLREIVANDVTAGRGQASSSTSATASSTLAVTSIDDDMRQLELELHDDMTATKDTTHTHTNTPSASPVKPVAMGKDKSGGKVSKRAKRIAKEEEAERIIRDALLDKNRKEKTEKTKAAKAKVKAEAEAIEEDKLDGEGQKCGVEVVEDGGWSVVTLTHPATATSSTGTSTVLPPRPPTTTTGAKSMTSSSGEYVYGSSSLSFKGGDLPAAAKLVSSNGRSTVAPKVTNACPLRCNTCGGNFEDQPAYRLHFRSDWHRYNLKQKMNESTNDSGVQMFPILTEEEFTALSPHEKRNIR